MKDSIKRERLEKAIKNAVEMDLTTHKQVAESIGISTVTLRKYYKEFPAKKLQIDFFLRKNRESLKGEKLR